MAVRDDWRREASRMQLREKTPQKTVATVTKGELQKVLPALLAGLLFSIVPAFAASYVVSSVAENFWHAYILGFVPSVVGLSIIATQIALIHEGIHHTVYKSTKWLPEARIGLAGFAATLSIYPLLFFLPMKNPPLLWKHPAISVHDAALMVFLAAAAPYIAKVIHDYLMLELSSVSVLWRVSLVILPIYFIVSTALVAIVSPERATLVNVLQRTAVTAISLAGVFYTLRGELRDRHEEQEYIELLEESEGKPKILFRIRDSRKITFFAAVVAGTGLPIIAGASVRSAFSGEVSASLISPGMFILFGYPKLLLFSWLFIFGPFVIGTIIFTVITAVSIANQRFISD